MSPTSCQPAPPRTGMEKHGTTRAPDARANPVRSRGCADPLGRLRGSQGREARGDDVVPGPVRARPRIESPSSSGAGDAGMADESGRVAWLWGPLLLVVVLVAVFQFAETGGVGSEAGEPPSTLAAGEVSGAAAVALPPGGATRPAAGGFAPHPGYPAAPYAAGPVPCPGMPALSTLGSVRVAAFVPSARRSRRTLLGGRRDGVGAPDRRVRPGHPGGPVLVGGGGRDRPVRAASNGAPRPGSRGHACTPEAMGFDVHAFCPTNRVSLISASRSRVRAMS